MKTLTDVKLDRIEADGYPIPDFAYLKSVRFETPRLRREPLSWLRYKYWRVRNRLRAALRR
jgi:hypothetical protein